MKLCHTIFGAVSTGALLLAMPAAVQAEEFTWLRAPVSGDWGRGANWSTGRPPNVLDTAIFGASGKTDVTIASSYLIGMMRFAADAPAYAFTIEKQSSLRVVGAGILNGSANIPTIRGDGKLFFNHSSTAGNASIVNLNSVSFSESSTAGTASISYPGYLYFLDSSTAGSATIRNGRDLMFAGTSTAGTASVFNSGLIQFMGGSTAGDATITTWPGGKTSLLGQASGGRAGIIVTARGRFDISLSTAGTSIGSLEGEGDVTLGRAMLTVGNNLSTTFSRIISGIGGSLTKVGSGTLTLSGANLYPGVTTVEAGELTVNGSLKSSVTVASGATLSGDGTVGGVMARSGATISPGNSIGTLQVNGNVTFDPGSVYQVEINGSGQSDRIAATGTATLNGGTVRILPDQGRYSLSPYTILTAKQGVTGQFKDTRVEHEFAFLNPVLDYGPDAVTLSLLERSAEPNENDKGGGGLIFNSVAATRNQYRVADAVERLGFGNDLFDTVLGASEEGARLAFDALSGEVHASFATVAYGDAQLLQNAILNRLRQPMASLPTLARGSYAAAYAAGRPGAAQTVAIVPTLDPRRFALWGEGFGSWGRIGSNSHAAGVEMSTGGFVVGAEVTIDETYRVGIAGGFLSTSFDVDRRLSSGANESVFGSIYGAARWDAFNLRLGTVFASHDVNVSRTINFPGFSDHASASYGGSSVMAFGEVGYELALGGVTVEPFVGASIMRLHKDGFHEEGGPAALTGSGRTYEIGTTTLGVRAEARLSDDLPLTLRGLVGWRHAFSDVEPTALLAFSGGASAFTVAGVPIDREALVAEAGLDWRINEDMALGLSYSGQVGSRAQEHALKGNFTWRF